MPSNYCQNALLTGVLALTIVGGPWVATTLATPKNGAADELLVYVGTYTRRGSEGIYLYRMNTKTGVLTALATTGGIKNPSFLALHPSRKYLYAVSEVAGRDGKPSGAVAAFRVSQRNGTLTPLNSQSSGGAGPCYVEVDHAGTHVLAANYGSGSVTVLPIDSAGRLGPATAFRQHQGSSVHPRQRGPHAHAIYPDQNDRFVLVPDLGLDKLVIYQYDVDAGTLAPNPVMPAAKLTPGSGPRHFAFGPSGKLCYAINELSSTVTAFRYDPERGTLVSIQTVSTLPAGFEGHNTTAEIVATADGRFVYGSNRGHDSIVQFAVDQATGKLTFVGTYKTLGKTPRNFAIDPSGQFLLAANQDSDNIVVFRIDRASGRLVATGQQARVPLPVCIIMTPSF